MNSQAIVTLCIVLLGNAPGFAQGIFAFDNFVVAAPDAISSVPGTYNPGDGLPGTYLGSDYTASLFFLNGIVTNQAIFDGSNPTLFAPADTRYDGGGYFVADQVYLSAATGQVVTAQVRAWYNGNGAYTSYAQSLATGHNVGESNPVEVFLVQGTQNPQPMYGLQSFTVGIPEPSTFALLVFHGAWWLWVSRRCNLTTRPAPCAEGR